MSGEPDTRDLESLITWLCRQDVSVRKRGSKHAGDGDDDDDDHVMIPLVLLEPTSLPAHFEQPMPGGGFSLAGSLLTGLRRRFRSYSKPTKTRTPSMTIPRFCVLLNATFVAVTRTVTASCAPIPAAPPSLH